MDDLDGNRGPVTGYVVMYVDIQDPATGESDGVEDVVSGFEPLSVRSDDPETVSA